MVAKRIELHPFVIFITYGPAFLLLIATIAAFWYKNVPFAFFSRDPAVTAGAHPLTGVQSDLGVLAWWSSGVICLFAVFVLRRAHAEKRICQFLLYSSALTFMLTLDDFFLFHESLAGYYLGLGEMPVVFAYAVACAWYLIYYRNIILSFEWIYLFLAFLFFGLSLVVDEFLQPRWDSDWRIFFEDGFKLLGIVSWSGYLIRACMQAITEGFGSARTAHGGFPPRGGEDTLV